MSAFIKAVYESSESVNLYSVLLGKINVYTERSTDYKCEISKLMSHLLFRLQNPGSVVSNMDTASW